MASLLLPLIASLTVLFACVAGLRWVWGREVWFAPATWFAAAWAIIFVGRPVRDQLVGDMNLEKGIYIGLTIPMPFTSPCWAWLRSLYLIWSDLEGPRSPRFRCGDRVRRPPF